MQVMDWDLIGSDDPLGDVCVQLSFLRCKTHPDGHRTLQDYPSVLCDASLDSRYSVITGVSIAFFLLTSVPYVLYCFWALNLFKQQDFRKIPVLKFLTRNRFRTH